MKKILALLLAMMILSFAACNKKSDSADDDGASDSKIPSAVSEEVKDCYDDMGIEVGSLKKEYKQSKDGVSFYIISGRINGSSLDEDDDDYDEDIEDYKGGYFICMAREYDGDVECMGCGGYEKDKKDDFKDDLEEVIEYCKDNEDVLKEGFGPRVKKNTDYIDELNELIEFKAKIY